MPDTVAMRFFWSCFSWFTSKDNCRISKKENPNNINAITPINLLALLAIVRGCTNKIISTIANISFPRRQFACIWTTCFWNTIKKAFVGIAAYCSWLYSYVGYLAMISGHSLDSSIQRSEEIYWHGMADILSSESAVELGKAYILRSESALEFGKTDILSSESGYLGK